MLENHQKKQDTKRPTDMLCRLKFYDHFELAFEKNIILEMLSLVYSDYFSAEHGIFCARNTIFVDCHRKAQSGEAGRVPLHEYYVRRAVDRQPGFRSEDW